MGNTAEGDNPAGCLAYVVGVMSFIPFVGVLFGVIVLIWSAVIKNKILKIIGVSGLLLNLIFFSMLGYYWAVIASIISSITGSFGFAFGILDWLFSIQ